MVKEGFVKAKRIESGKFPKSSFIGTLKDAYFTTKQVKNANMTVLQCDFKEGQTYNMRAQTNQSEKAKTEDGLFGVHEDGSYDDFIEAGQWIASVEALGVQVSFGFIDGIPTGIDFEPEIRGLPLHNIARLGQVGDESQTSKYPDWTIGQIDGLGTVKSAPTPTKSRGGYPAKPKAPKESTPASSNITGAVMELLPASVGEIYEVLKKKNVKCLPSDIRAVLEAEGAKDIGNNKWQVM